MYKRIRDLREDKDISQTTLAKVLGMSQTGYSKYETGENDIPTNILIKLALFHDTSVDYLLGLTDERKPYLHSKAVDNTINKLLKKE
ncbi:MAG: helix-turn-helix transcriptional regulator [Lachnospiraceae bacterium]|nr:helix-turn-helix transcriptional regulator [Lachnospiraceae bacterium]